MVDSLNDAQPAIVRREDGKAAWELSAPAVAYPLSVDFGGKEYQIYVHTLLYLPDDLITALNSTGGGYRRSLRDVEILPGDESAYAVLTDRVFAFMEGTTAASVETQKKFLDSNTKLKVRIALEGLGGITIRRNIPEEVPDNRNELLELLPIALDMSSEILVPVKQTLWNAKEKKKVEIEMNHIVRTETEADWRRWQRTIAETFAKGNKLWRVTVNWWQRGELYDAMIARIDGMLVHGKPCTADNKADWIKLVPYWHKLLVVSEVFDESRVKN